MYCAYYFEFYVMIKDCFMYCVDYIFFFKQKTAYEMRISDWSQTCALPIWVVLVAAGGREQRGRRFGGLGIGAAFEQEARKPPVAGGAGHAQRGQAIVVERGHLRGRVEQQRSEEHTSELQSQMRISYAVYCLKKNKINRSSTCPT